MRDLAKLYPEFYHHAKPAIERDLERVVILTATLSEVRKDDSYFNGFSNSFRGHVARALEVSLAADLAAAVSRLYAPLGRVMPSDDLSLTAVAWHFENNHDDIFNLFRRNARRWGASGTSSITDHAGARPATWVEMLSMRKRSGRQQEADSISQMLEWIDRVKEFSHSELYWKVRSYRSERVSHQIKESRDRKKYNLPKNYSLNYDDLILASNEAILIGESAFGAFFKHHLSLDDLSRYWREYAKEFWHYAAGLQPPEIRFDD